MENEIRYNSVPDCSPVIPWFAPWHMVISQVECKTKKSVGEIMETIEALNMPDKQEKALKSIVKSILYENANDALDWMAQCLSKPIGDTDEQMAAAMVHINPTHTIVPNSIGVPEEVGE